MELLPEAGVMDSLGPTENGLSVNMSGLKPSRVLEVYVKRSVSLREGGFTDKELKWRSLPAKIPQKITSRRNGPGLSDPGIRCRAREREQNERESKTRGDETVPPVSNSSSVEPTVEKEASKGRSKDGKKGKKSQTFFSKVASFLWRRKGDEKKDEGGKRSKESGLPPEEHPPAQNGEQPLADSQEPPEELAIAHKPKSTKKKSSLRRVFSFKKNNFEVKGFGSGSPGTSKSKAVRPSQLDLRDVCGPMHGKTDPDTECLYEQATEEVKRIVQTLESSEGCENKGGSLAEELETQGPTETVDKTIWKIVAILQNVGDHVDTELQGNSLLSTFFADMSYNSFKQLADQYIEKEVRSKVTQANSDLVKFAFTLDFTAKVAGICSHQIKRITGFGSQYLQDACWQLPSFSDQQETENNTEKIPSPD